MREADFSSSYDRVMGEAGLVICILPCGEHRVSYHYQLKSAAGPQVGWKTDSDGNRVALHAVRYLEGDSYTAMGRLLNPAVHTPQLLGSNKNAQKQEPAWGL